MGLPDVSLFVGRIFKSGDLYIGFTEPVLTIAGWIVGILVVVDKFPRIPHM
jgi:hypothetical protein